MFFVNVIKSDHGSLDGLMFMHQWDKFKYNQIIWCFEMLTREQLKDKFTQLTFRRQNENGVISGELAEHLTFMEQIIKKDFQNFNLFSFSICGAGRRNVKVSAEFERGFVACGQWEKVEYYEVGVNYLADAGRQTSLRVMEVDVQGEEVLVKIVKGIKTKEACRIILRKNLLDCKNYQIDLTTYILRQSRKEPRIYLFQSITQQEPITIRLEIAEFTEGRAKALVEMGRKNFKLFLQRINRRDAKTVEQKPITLQKDTMKVKQKTEEVREETVSEIKMQVIENKNEVPFKQAKENFLNNKSVIEQLMDNNPNSINEEIYQYLDRKKEEDQNTVKSKAKLGKLHKNQLHLLLPQFNIDNLDAFTDFVIKYKNEQKKMFIYYSQKHNSYKLELIVNCQSRKLLTQICEVQNEKLWNSSINQSQIKWAISSQNAYIIYRKQKAYSEWYRQRDFVFIKYLFKKGNSHYLIERSIENTHFIPFQSIHRGNIHYSVCRLDPFSDGVKIVMQLSVDYGGMLTQEQKKDLTLAYLKEWVHLQGFVNNFKKQTKNVYDYDWQIQSQVVNLNNSSMASISSSIFGMGVEPLDDVGYDAQSDDEESFYSIHEEVVTAEISPEQKQNKLKLIELKEYNNEEVKLSQEGFAILPQKYLQVKHPKGPISVPERRRKITYENIMLKDDFVIDKDGGMLLVNQTKIAAQNNVIKFIMSTLKKNLFSGKGILNISLPVQIFNVDSNLQRLCESLGLAPDLIEKKALCTNDTVERFKHCIAFGLTNSIFYFDIDKVFNPILGETYQGVIDGCPVYAQQISHHPPITSILLYGRGYKIYANIEAKVYVHLNSGQGVNEGFYTIQFDNGDKILFQTAPGEVSGLAVGDRKYRIKGKMFVIDPKNRLCCFVNFQDEAGMFSSKKWKFTDQMDGQIYKVSEGYVRSFFGRESGKDMKGPSKKEIEQTLGKIEGRWIEKLMIDGKVYYDIKWMPYEMIHYEFPLNSNSNYRQDLIYRKLDNLARSQQQKQRLEVLQRNDRKFRDKYGKTKGH